MALVDVSKGASSNVTLTGDVTGDNTATVVSTVNGQTASAISSVVSQLNQSAVPANKVLASPNGSAGAYQPRSLVNSDLPLISLTKLDPGTATTGQVLSYNGTSIVASTPAAGVTYPLTAPTNTTAYSFTGQSTTGIGYDTATNSLTLYGGGNPSIKVSTTGAVTVSGAANTQALTAAGAVTAQSTLAVTGNTTLSTATMSGLLAASNVTTQALTASGALNAQSTLSVTGNTTLSTATLSGALTAQSINAQAVTAAGALTAQSTLAVTGSTTLAATTIASATVSGATNLQGPANLTEQSSAPSTSGTVGALYAKTSDKNLYFKTSAGTEYAITPPATGGGGGGSTTRSIINYNSGSNNTATAAQSGTIFSIPGGGTITLPPATPGLQFTLVDTGANAIRFLANAADTITYNGRTIPASTNTAIYAQSLGDTIQVTCLTAGAWIATDKADPGYLQICEQTSVPPNFSAIIAGAPTDIGLLYSKSTDKNLYYKTSAGNEYALTPPASGSASFPLTAPANGTPLFPNYTFTGSTSTGLYSPSANALALAVNATAALSFSSSGNATFSAFVTVASDVTSTNGRFISGYTSTSPSSPAFAVNGNNQTGVYGTTSMLGLTAQGTACFNSTNALTTFPLLTTFSAGLSSQKFLTIESSNTPATISGQGALFARSDKNLYYRNSDGTEYAITPPPTGSTLAAAPVVNISGNQSATTAQAGTIFVVTGATTLTTPAATAANVIGLTYTVVQGSTGGSPAMAIAVPAGDMIYYGGGAPFSSKASGQSYQSGSSAYGSMLKILCIALNKWIITDITGTWS